MFLCPLKCRHKITNNGTDLEKFYCLEKYFRRKVIPNKKWKVLFLLTKNSPLITVHKEKDIYCHNIHPTIK